MLNGGMSSTGQGDTVNVVAVTGEELYKTTLVRPSDDRSTHISNIHGGEKM